MFQAYAEGVNAYIDQNYKSLPVEFVMLNYKPSQWQIEDCISIILWLDWNMSIGWREDILLGTFMERFSPDQVKNLLPFTGSSVRKNPPLGEKSMLSLFEDFRKLQNETVHPGSGFGGNAWAVSGVRSVTGQPLLANDPHLSLDCPSFFYENHLGGGGFNVTGMSIPGLPGVIYGHNKEIAWGLSSLMADNLDFFVMILNPMNSTEYLYNGSYRHLEIIEEEIPVRMNSPVHMTVYQTHFGPIVSSIPSDNQTDRRLLAIRWTGYEIKDPGLAFYRLNLASDWESFREALRMYENAPQNFIFADHQGEIGLQAAGKIPLRAEDSYFLPKPGTTSEFDWKGYIPFDALPSEKNPSSGFLAAANNTPDRNLSPGSPALPRALSSRIKRIENLLSEKETYSVQDFKRFQSDFISLYNRDIIDNVLPVIRHGIPRDSSLFNILDELEQWDGTMKPGSASAVLSQVFIEKCLRNLFWDEMDDALFNDFVHLQSICLPAFQHVLEQDISPWFDNIKTRDRIETRDDIVLKSFQETITELQEKMGKEWQAWSWGNIHSVTFLHPLGQNSLLSNTLCLGPFHVGGSGTTINCLGHSLIAPYDVVWGPAARSIYDLSNWDNSVSVNSTGQSGQPLDSHYRDQVQLYLGNLYHPNLADTSKILHSGWDLLELISGGAND
jgi:penicillin amidase